MNNKTILYSHPACLLHDAGAGHPEKSERLKAILAKLDSPEFSALARRTAPRIERNQLSRVHDIAYISKVFSTVPEAGEAKLTPDTVLSPDSGEASMMAAGAVCAAVDAVAAGEALNSFCAVRPPGHHTGPTTTMGSCVFNNVAIGAEHARAVHGFERVAIIDFDVHHGNGTQAIYRRDPKLFFASIHQSFIFPKSGHSTETGSGNIVNVPLVRNTSVADYRLAFEHKIIPRLNAYRPDFVFISAGFDAHVCDPIGELKLMTADYRWLTEGIMEVAARHAGGRLVSVLEGGYDPEALANACAEHVRALMAA